MHPWSPSEERRARAIRRHTEGGMVGKGRLDERNSAREGVSGMLLTVDACGGEVDREPRHVSTQI